MSEGLGGGREGGDRVSEKGMREGAGDGDLMRRRLEDRLTRAGNFRQSVAIEEPGSAQQSQADVLPELANPAALDAQLEKAGEPQAGEPLGVPASPGPDALTPQKEAALRNWYQGDTEIALRKAADKGVNWKKVLEGER